MQIKKLWWNGSHFFLFDWSNLPLFYFFMFSRICLSFVKHKDTHARTSLSLSLSLSLYYIYIYIYIYIYTYICIYMQKCFCRRSKERKNYSKMNMSTKGFVFFKICIFISFLNTCMFAAYCFRQRTYMAQGLVNIVLNETWTHSCLKFSTLNPSEFKSHIYHIHKAWGHICSLTKALSRKHTYI